MDWFQAEFNFDLKTLLHRDLSEPEFERNLVYKLKQIIGRTDFSDQLRKNTIRWKRIA